MDDKEEYQLEKVIVSVKEADAIKTILRSMAGDIIE